VIGPGLVLRAERLLRRRLPYFESAHGSGPTSRGRIINPEKKTATILSAAMISK
jgi:isocitrate/isopropylmalate dehydrogenase